MPQARRSIDIHATAESVFHAITDYARYPDFLPDVTRVEIVDRQEHVKVVTFELNLFKLTIIYTLRIVEEPFRRLHWTLVDSNWLKKVEGGWELETLNRQITRATYIQELKIKGLMPRIVSTKLVDFSLPAMLQQFKDTIEGKA